MQTVDKLNSIFKGLNPYVYLKPNQITKPFPKPFQLKLFHQSLTVEIRTLHIQLCKTAIN